MISRVCAAAVACALVVSSAGCTIGGSGYVSTTEFERDIAADLSARLQGFAIDDVECPGKIKARTGTKVRCTAITRIGQEILLSVTVKRGGDSYTFNVVDDVQAFDRPDFEKTVHDAIQKAIKVDSVVRCPQVVMEQGHEFECTATDATRRKIKVHVMQKDDDGNVDLSY